MKLIQLEIYLYSPNNSRYYFSNVKTLLYYYLLNFKNIKFFQNI